MRLIINTKVDKQHPRETAFFRTLCRLPINYNRIRSEIIQIIMDDSCDKIRPNLCPKYEANGLCTL